MPRSPKPAYTGPLKGSNRTLALYRLRNQMREDKDLIPWMEIAESWRCATAMPIFSARR